MLRTDLERAKQRKLWLLALPTLGNGRPVPGPCSDTKDPEGREGRSEGKGLACVSPALSHLICPSRGLAPGSPLRINRAPRCLETCPSPQVHRDGPSFQSPPMQEHQRRADRTGLTLSTESLPVGGLWPVWEPGFQEGSRHATRHRKSGSPCLRHLGK